MNIRQPIQDAIIAGLADSATGFNARLVALADTYRITPFRIDFTRETSDSLVECFIDGQSALELSQIKTYPAAVVYSSLAQFTGPEKGYGFAGHVQFHVDIYLRFRARDDNGVSAMETSNTESLANATEAAVLGVFHQQNFAWPSGVIYNRAWQGGREQLVQFPDGYAQRVPIQMQFKVTL